MIHLLMTSLSLLGVIDLKADLSTDRHGMILIISYIYLSRAIYLMLISAQQTITYNYLVQEALMNIKVLCDVRYKGKRRER